MSKESTPPRTRYDGLDTFRVVGIYVVVMAHFHLGWAPEVSLGRLVQLRGCAFPIVILTSFFVVSRSLLAKPDMGFVRFLAARFKRIGMPFLIWTVVYWALFEVAYPLRHGAAPVRPAPTLLFSGYMHLWFLQFIFLGSLALHPLLRRLGGRAGGRRLLAACCLLATLVHLFWTRGLVERALAGRMEQFDLSLWVFVVQINSYFGFVPVAVGLALYAEGLQNLLERRTYRALSLLAVAATMGAHLAFDSLRFTKGLYSLAVFVALLRTPPAAVVNILRPLAAYSYPVYILHYLISALVTYKVFFRARAEATLGNVLLGSLLVFGLSLFASVVLRRLFPRDWFLPLVPISRRGRDPSQASQG